MFPYEPAPPQNKEYTLSLVCGLHRVYESLQWATDARGLIRILSPMATITSCWVVEFHPRAQLRDLFWSNLLASFVGPSDDPTVMYSPPI